MSWKESGYSQEDQGNMRRVTPVNRHDDDNTRNARDATHHPSGHWWNQRYLAPTSTYRDNMDASCTASSHDSYTHHDGCWWTQEYADADVRTRHHRNRRLEDGLRRNDQPCGASVGPGWNDRSDEAYARYYDWNGTSSWSHYASNSGADYGTSYGSRSNSNSAQNDTSYGSRYASNSAQNDTSYGSRYASGSGADYGTSYGLRYNNDRSSARNDNTYVPRSNIDNSYDNVRRDRGNHEWRPRNARTGNETRRWRSPLCLRDEAWIEGQGWGWVTQIGSTPHRVLMLTRVSNALFWCNCSRYSTTNSVTVSSCLSVGRVRNGVSRAASSLQFREITPEDYDLLCSLDAEVPSSKGMPTAFIKTLSAGLVGGTCGVCLDTIDEDGDPRILPCSMGHSFHFSCIGKWLTEKTTCPLDMTDLAAEKGQ